MYAESIRMIKPENYFQELVEFSNNRSQYQDLITQCGRSKDCGNELSLASSTSAGDEDQNETAIDTGNGALENAEENVEVSSRHTAA